MDSLSDILIDPIDFDISIHRAAFEGDVDHIRNFVSEQPELAKDLLERKVRPLGSTPLRLASTGGHVDVVRFLLDELGASVDSSDFKGQTPLHVTVKGGHDQCARVLLEHGANPDGSLENVCSPLYVATQLGYIKCVLLLLEYGADANDWKRLAPHLVPPSPDNPVAYELYSQLVKSVNTKRTNMVVISQTPLYASVLFNRPDCYAALLMIGGAEPDLRLFPGLSNTMVCGLSLAHSFLGRNLSNFFVRLFVLFGGYLWQRDRKGSLAIESNSTYPSSSILVYKTYMENPLSLQNMCRICIRRCVGRKRLSSLSSLPLPTALIDILYYKDEIDENYEPIHEN